MKLTFAVLFACWTIYSSSNAVLSLPPSLIANAASLQAHHDHHHDKVKRDRSTPAAAVNSSRSLDKDVAYSPSLLNTGTLPERASKNEGGIIVPDTIIQRSDVIPNLGETNENHQRISRMAEISSSATQLGQQNRNVYDLSEFLQAIKIPDETRDNIDDDISQSMKELHSLLPPIQAQLKVQHHSQAQAQAQSQPDANEFFTPLKHWARHCQPGSNCPPQYYRALYGNRNSNNEVGSLMEPQNGSSNGYKGKNIERTDDIALNDKFDEEGNYDESDTVHNYADEHRNINEYNDNDVFMFLNGEQDLIKFLRWAMHLLYQNKNVANYTGDGAEYYHPGMYIWKAFNLSGRIEPPLFVEEPHYIYVRREQLNDDIKMNSKYNKNDPFIPPRGRKHNMPDLDALLHRYETFVPNRGRRDKIKDMLKSNDLFFPNRGKKQMPTPLKRDFEYENGRLRSSNSNTKAKGKATTTTASVRSTNDASDDADADADSIDESKSSSSDNIVAAIRAAASAAAAVDDDDNEWNKALPIAILMRDVLEKLMREEVQRNEKHFLRQLKADGNKITTNAHEINNLDDMDKISNKNRPQWLESMLNYKYNSFDPSVEQSMPVAVAINGKTREMSTLQKMAALAAAETSSAAEAESDTNTETDTDSEVAGKGHALQQLLEEIQILPIDSDGEGDDDRYGDGDIGIGVDRGGTRIASNRLRSTRSMSTTMAQRRQKQQRQQLKQRQPQKERIQRLMQQRRLMRISKDMNDGNIYTKTDEDQKQQQYQKHQNHRQVKPFTNPIQSDPLLSRQLQLMQQGQEQQQNKIQHFQQKLHRLERQRDTWPQKTPLLQSDAFDSPYTGSNARAATIIEGLENDYNYSDN